MLLYVGVLMTAHRNISLLGLNLKQICHWGLCP